MERKLNKLTGEEVCKILPIILTHVCMHCKRNLNVDESVCAIGPPYCALVHRTCVDFFNYSKGWPHSLPFQFYPSD